MKIHNIALRNIFRNFRRSLLSVSAIAIAAMAITIMFAIIGGLQSEIAANIQDYDTGQIRIRHRLYDQYQAQNPLQLRVEGLSRILPALEAVPGVAAVVPRISSPVMIYDETENRPVMLLGMDFAREAAFSGLGRQLAEQPAVPGAVMGTALAETLLASRPDGQLKLTLMAMTMRRSTNAKTVLVDAVLPLSIPTLNSGAIIVSHQTAASLLRMGDASTSLLVKLDPGQDGRAFARQLNTWLAGQGHPDLEARFWQDIPTSYNMLEMAVVAYSFIALFFFILGSSVIVNTTMMVIFERMREIGTIAALGMTGRQIVQLFFTEAVFLGAIGAALGALLGSGISVLLNTYGLDMSAAWQNVSIETSGILRPALAPHLPIVVFLFATLVAGAASLLPSMRAAKIKPVEALRRT